MILNSIWIPILFAAVGDENLRILAAYPPLVAYPLLAGMLEHASLLAIPRVGMETQNYTASIKLPIQDYVLIQLNSRVS